MRKINDKAMTLIKAKALIQDPRKWWDGVEAVPLNEKFCAVQAIANCAPSQDRIYDIVNLADRVARANYSRNTVKVNDELGHGEVMKLFDAAITEAMSDGT